MKPVALILALAAFAAAPQDKQDDKTERIRRAIEYFADPDPQVRELGRKELVALGADAVPYLEKLLELRNALDIHKLLKEVDRRAGIDGRWAELPIEEELPKEPAKVDRTETDRYVKAKLRDAHAAAKRGNYQRGYDITNALLILEPQSMYVEDIRKVRKYCDNWITQTSLVRSRLMPAAPGGAVGGRHEFTLRMENVFKQAVRILYDPGTPEKPSRPVVVVEITCRKLDVHGGETIAMRSVEVHVEHEIPIAMGAQWEHVFSIEVDDFPADTEDVRIYTIGAWTQPMKLDYGIGTVTKRLLFEPAVFKAVPQKHDHLLENPLKSLELTLAAGTVNEAFIAAMLISEEQKPLAVELLVKELERAEKAEGRVVLAQILTTLTGHQLGLDVKRWRAYAETLKPRKEQPKK